MNLDKDAHDLTRSVEPLGWCSKFHGIAGAPAPRLFQIDFAMGNGRPDVQCWPCLFRADVSRTRTFTLFPSTMSEHPREISSTTPPSAHASAERDI